MSNILDSIKKSVKRSTSVLEEKASNPDGNDGKTDFDMKAQLEKKMKKEADMKDKEDMVKEDQEVEDENIVASSNSKIEKGLDVTKESKKLRKEADAKDDEKEFAEDDEKDIEDVKKESKRLKKEADAKKDDLEEDDYEDMKKEADAKKDDYEDMKKESKRLKKEADAKKDDLEEDDEIEEDDAELEKDKIKIEKRVKKEDINLSEHIAALFNGEKGITDKFKDKTKTILEAAVLTVANKVVAEQKADLQVKFTKQINAFKDKYDTLMVEKVDGYMDKVITEWWTANKVPAQKSMKLELAESFFVGLKTLFTEHYVDINDQKVDVLGKLAEKAELLEAKLDKEINANLNLRDELTEMKKEKLISESSGGLSANEKDKFKTLAESVDFTSEDTYSSKLQEIKDSYFTEQTTITSVDADDEPITAAVEETKAMLSEGQQYADVISRLLGSGKPNKTINKTK